MGQGLHTKIAQVTASAFDIPLSSVFISETSTYKVPNASPRTASASSDMYGAAVLDACLQIKARMEPVASITKFNSFEELASQCYEERTDLSAHGFYITPDIGFDWESGKGKPFRYYTYGAVFAEVEIDTLTGDFHTRTADLILELLYEIFARMDPYNIGKAAYVCRKWKYIIRNPIFWLNLCLKAWQKVVIGGKLNIENKK